MNLKIFFETLGCPKNETDSEWMMTSLCRSGALICQNPKEANIIIVNTCSFIKEAVNESIDRILELAKWKKNGSCCKLIVTGCLPQRYQKDIASALPEVDSFLGTGAYDQINTVVFNPTLKKQCLFLNPDNCNYPTGIHRMPPNHVAYIKIAEGCSHRCTYCIIPVLRGRHRSRPVNHIIEEACWLVDNGVKEIIIVAQDTTFYGNDNPDFPDIADLLIQIIKNLKKRSFLGHIRLMYANPKHISEKLIKVIADNPILCPYIDMPIQHCSNKILKKMGRHYNQDEILTLINTMRYYIPDIAIRTTILVGFPGETDKDLEEIISFMKTIKFDHLGVFSYSDADDLPSHHLPNHISEKEKENRLDSIMSLQADLSHSKLKRYIGKTLSVLVDRFNEDNPTQLETRSVYQAPEIDGVTWINNSNIQLGQSINVRIIKALDYDLIGVIV